MIVDHITNWRKYDLGEAWTKAFEFLEKLSVDAEEKEYPIDGDGIFARVMSYPTKLESDADAVLEAHQRYVDIQVALSGSERIAVYPSHELKTKEGYNAVKDVEFFEYEKPANVQLCMYPGTFACLFPQDAHMPQLFTEDERVVVKKVVVKIRRERLSV